MKTYQIVSYKASHVRNLTTTPAGLRAYLKKRIKNQEHDVYLEVWEDDPHRDKGGQILALFIDGKYKDAAVMECFEEYE